MLRTAFSSVIGRAYPSMPNVSLAIKFAVMQRVLRFKHLALQLFAACLVVHLTAPAAMPQQPPKRPLITGIDHITIYVSDVNKSRQFYSDVLGLTVGRPQYSGSGAFHSPSKAVLNGGNIIRHADVVWIPAHRAWN